VIVLETSALVAVLRGEPERARILSILALTESITMSAFSRYEASVVLLGKGETDALDAVDRFLNEMDTNIAPFDEYQFNLAFHAYAKFGKGSGSAAKLNLADCVAYALAKHLTAPLLFIGNDFAHTDIVPALP
jgi:ribonuclease VapC